MGLAQYVNKSTNPQPLAQSNFCRVSVGYQLSGHKGGFITWYCAQTESLSPNLIHCEAYLALFPLALGWVPI